MLHPEPALKVLFLVTCAVGYHISLTPPTKAPKHSQETYRGHFFDYAARYLALLHKTIACTLLLCEILVVIAATTHETAPHHTILQTLCPRAVESDDAPHLSSLHYSLVAGVALMVFATCIRIWCYRTLNNMFTFELTIRRGHSLITSGPYAYVRHTSYTAATMNMFAFLIVHFAYGSWQRECEASSQVWWKWAISVYILDVAYTIVCLWQRGPAEDAQLRAHFGAKWDEYRKHVPRMYVPFVY
ncbi:hypothetical protein PENSPDRAFT_623477 [Peniophora sp. CONT]|nr:hypothetical protein PENSPDRAFT_623477 [Peniophora sp. CONT]